jgi:DNA-directed RNA polymerase specialized sigma24 family protein
MESLDRVERLLGLLLIQQMRSAPQGEKALCLNLAGFTNTEIADLLQTKATTIAQSLYEARRKPKKRSRA